MRFKTLSMLMWINYRDIDKKVLRTQINRVIDNAIYWFGYCVIYKQKKSATLESNRFFEFLFAVLF